MSLMVLVGPGNVNLDNPDHTAVSICLEVLIHKGSKSSQMNVLKVSFRSTSSLCLGYKIGVRNQSTGEPDTGESASDLWQMLLP